MVRVPIQQANIPLLIPMHFILDPYIDLPPQHEGHFIIIMLVQNRRMVLDFLNRHFATEALDTIAQGQAQGILRILMNHHRYRPRGSAAIAGINPGKTFSYIKHIHSLGFKWFRLIEFSVHRSLLKSGNETRHLRQRTCCAMESREIAS
jgi:hypothetical protein